MDQTQAPPPPPPRKKNSAKKLSLTSFTHIFPAEAICCLDVPGLVNHCLAELEPGKCSRVKSNGCLILAVPHEEARSFIVKHEMSNPEVPL